MSGHSADHDRRAELADALAAVRDRVDIAARSAGRDPQSITTIVVTKYFPASDVSHLVSLGVSDIGESKDQEASAKLDQLDDPLRRSLQVHFVGQLQTNKAPSIAGYCDVVHSVDRARLVRALGKASQHAVDAGQRQGALAVLLQVDLDSPAESVVGPAAGASGGDTAKDQARRAEQGAPARGGADPATVLELAELVVNTPALELAGVMAVAPRGASEQETAASFAKLASISAELQTEHRSATWISAGMSGDLELAVRAGATHLRVGSAILGSRPQPR